MKNSTDAEVAAINILRHTFHGEWNYTISPRPEKQSRTLSMAEVLGMEVGTSEAEPIWTEFLRRLTRRGLHGVKLVVSDAQEGVKAAVAQCIGSCLEERASRVVSAFLAKAFAQDTAESASMQWRIVADQVRSKVPKPPLGMMPKRMRSPT